MGQPIYTTLKPVFDAGVLYPGRAVRLGGYSEEGEKLEGIYLIRGCKYEHLVLIDHYGTTITVHIDDVLRDDPYARTTITPLEG